MKKINNHASPLLRELLASKTGGRVVVLRKDGESELNFQFRQKGARKTAKRTAGILTIAEMKGSLCEIEILAGSDNPLKKAERIETERMRSSTLRTWVKERNYKIALKEQGASLPEPSASIVTMLPPQDPRKAASRGDRVLAKAQNAEPPPRTESRETVPTPTPVIQVQSIPETPAPPLAQSLWIDILKDAMRLRPGATNEMNITAANEAVAAFRGQFG